jgi:WD40 repeat protein
MESLNEMRRVLSEVLPEHLQAQVDLVAEFVVNIAQGELSPEKASITFPVLFPENLLAFLAGKEIRTKEAVVSFGSGNSIGDISIGNIANGNIYEITINVQNVVKRTGKSILEPSYIIPEIEQVFSLSWSPNGQFLGWRTRGRSTRIWDLRNRKLIRTFSKITGGIAWNPDSSYFASDPGMSGRILIRSVNSGEVAQSIQVADRIGSGVDWSPDGNYIVLPSIGGPIYVWQANDGAFLGELRDKVDVHLEAYSTSWSRSELLACGSSNSWVHIWDISNKNIVHKHKMHTGHVRSLDWSPYGSVVASGGTEGLVCICDVDTKQVKKVLEVDPDGVTAVCFSNKGTFLVVVDWENRIHVYQSGSWEKIALVEQEQDLNGRVFCRAAFNPHQPILATISGWKTIQLWDLKDDNLIY